MATKPKRADQPLPDTALENIDSVYLKAVAIGDRQAFASIVERWQRKLINFFYRSTGNLADAEDLVQETFVDLFKVADRYDDRGTFSAFLFTLARRKLIDGYRKKARRPLDLMDPQAFTMQSQPEPEHFEKEIIDAFHQALQTLPDNQRIAILMLQQQGLSYDEIAETMNASKSSVKTWIHRARQHLKTELKDYYEHG